MDSNMDPDPSLPVMQADVDGPFPLEGLPPPDFEALAHATSMLADSNGSYMAASSIPRACFERRASSGFLSAVECLSTITNRAARCCR